MHVLIFGLGLHGGGESAARYYLAHGASVRVTDKNDTPALRERCAKLNADCRLGIQTLDDTLWADLVVKNPAVKPDHPLLKDAKRITSDITCLLDAEATKRVKLIAVTGTKGKTTTATAIATVLNQLGHRTELCGNMGISAYDVLSRWEQEPLPEYLVMELSSWQIRDAEGHFKALEAAVMTSFYPDHQNSYASLEEYLADKKKLFGSWAKRMLAPKGIIPGAEEIDEKHFPRKELEPAYNVLISLGLPQTDVQTLLLGLQAVPYRNELVRTMDNIQFINDSAATIAEAVHYTLSLHPNSRIHLITGGTEKNLSAEAMEDDLTQVASVTLLDGSFTTGKLLPYLKKKHIAYGGPFRSMQEAVEDATGKARQGEGNHLVILSPGSASFGLFANEFDRGDQFCQCVRALL